MEIRSSLNTFSEFLDTYDAEAEVTMSPKQFLRFHTSVFPNQPISDAVKWYHTITIKTDTEKEIARAKKQIDELQKYVASLESK